MYIHADIYLPDAWQVRQTVELESTWRLWPVRVEHSEGGITGVAVSSESSSSASGDGERLRMARWNGFLASIRGVAGLTMNTYDMLVENGPNGGQELGFYSWSVGFILPTPTSLGCARRRGQDLYICC
jgi:hypothetical protein